MLVKKLLLCKFRKQGIEYRDKDGTIYIINPRNGNIYVLNESAAAIWQFLNEASIDELVSRLSLEFGASKEQILNDVMEFINFALQSGILTCE